MLVTYWLHKCPHCGVPYRTTIFTRGRGTPLGPGYHTCRYCHQAFADGSIEWSEMSVFQRIALFIPKVAWPFVALLLLLPFLLLYLQGFEAFAEVLTLEMVAAVVFAIVFAPLWIYRILQVRQSSRRVAGIPGRGLVSPAAGALLVIAAAAAVVAAGMLGIIPNIYARRAIEEHRAQAEAKLARIDRIARGVPRDVVDDAHWNEASVVKLTGVAPTADSIITLHVENLGDLTRSVVSSRALPVAFCRSWDTVKAAAFVRTGRHETGERIGLFDNSDLVREAFQRFQRRRFLLVVRGTAYEPPAPGERDSFTAGHYAGEALLYHIESRRRVGGVRFEAWNSGAIRRTHRPAIEDLEANLSDNAAQAMLASLGEHLPRVAADPDPPCLVR